MNTYYHELVKTNKDLFVRLIHTVDCTVSAPAHWHQHLEFVCVLDGQLNYKINNTNYHLNKGDLIFANPKVIHSTLAVSANEAIVLQIPYELLKEYIPDIDHIYFDCDFNHIDEKSAEALDKIKSILNHLYVTYDKKPQGYSLLIYSRIFELLFIMYYTFRKDKQNNYTNLSDKYLNRLEPILDYIENHYCEKITLAEIAAHANLTPTYFERFFKNCMGCTLMQYINSIRLDKCYNELLNTDQSSSYISANHGFTNYKYFVKLFKEQYHCMPSSLRQPKTVNR
jgi:AraC-like DNA-binding protein